jgi:anaerobic ribonucleoside-triphosphate reductase activating protein
VPPRELAQRIVQEASTGTDGVTVSGGEPMQQALSLYALLTVIRTLRPNWSLGMFTGYTMDVLNSGDYTIPAWPDFRLKERLWTQLAGTLDFAITGRFNRSQPRASLPQDVPYRHAVSSANQEIWLFTRRYTYSDFRPLSVEVKISPNGLTQVTGFPVKGPAK